MPERVDRWDMKRATETDVPGSLSGATVVVTGGAGSIGSRLASVLADVRDLIVIDDFTTADRARSG